MKMRKFAGFMLAGTMLLSTLSGCGSTIVDQAGSAGAESAASSEQTQSTEDKTDLTEKVSLKINYAAGNKSRTITYNQESPLTLPDGTVYTAGMLKPMWDYVETALNCELTDITTQDQKATEMIDIASTTNFSEANIFGGNSIADDLMYYGTEGKFVNLSDMMAQGYMPNFKAYLDANPDVKTAITAYDGNIYHAPYIAELNNFARSFSLRQSWVTMLLDDPNAAYDTNGEFEVYYDGFYVGDNTRGGDNGGTVTPKEGVEITKKTDQSIIEIQNELAVKNGETLTKAMVQYINDNYDYEKPSELFLGEKAAYDIDELRFLENRQTDDSGRIIGLRPTARESAKFSFAVYAAPETKRHFSGCRKLSLNGNCYLYGREKIFCHENLSLDRGCLRFSADRYGQGASLPGLLRTARRTGGRPALADDPP